MMSRLSDIKLVDYGIVELWNQPLFNEELKAVSRSDSTTLHFTFYTLRFQFPIANGNIFTLATFPYPQQWAIPLSHNYIIPQFHNLPSNA